MNQNILLKISSIIFVFKQFLIGLKQNLREEDNLSTRDKWPVPKVSFVRRFYCSCHVLSCSPVRTVLSMLKMVKVAMLDKYGNHCISLM